MIRPGQLYRVVRGEAEGEVLNVIGELGLEYLIHLDKRSKTNDFTIEKDFFNDKVEEGDYVLIYDPEDAKLQSFQPTFNTRLSDIE